MRWCPGDVGGGWIDWKLPPMDLFWCIFLFTKNARYELANKKNMPRKTILQTVGMQNSVKKSDPKGSLSTSAASTSRTVPKVGTAPQLAQSASCGADTNATNSARWLMDSVDAWFKVQN